ncbi:vacuolar sorting protein 18-like [Arachis duranensis]|uniref:Vacuolar sorting protein 18-like n=1 Tax=Arachis duranensis TaxID=130453 RepID=A0A9C6TP58_ARADU|nr:vacuolar sorting protein 18-like [Arachis duranensis]QHO49534.1 uncharacterized protein DS421_1g14800 [Arachis hypogaea]
MKPLESYGRVDELVYFASLKGHYEIAVHHYIQYKFPPNLIALDAYETVKSWMAMKIPAMMRYSSETHAKNETHEVIKYLEYCVHRLHNEDSGVHNLLLSLYAKQVEWFASCIYIYP